MCIEEALMAKIANNSRPLAKSLMTFPGPTRAREAALYQRSFHGICCKRPRIICKSCYEGCLDTRWLHSIQAQVTTFYFGVPLLHYLTIRAIKLSVVLTHAEVIVNENKNKALLYVGPRVKQGLKHVSSSATAPQRHIS